MVVLTSWFDDKLVVGRTTVPRHCPPSHAHWRNVESAAGRFKVPRHRWNSLACWHDNKSAAEWTTMPWHCRPFPRSLVRWRRRRADNGVSLLHHWQWGADKAMAVAARPIIMPLESRPSLARSRMGWRRRRLTAGQWWWCDQWRGNVSALLAVPLLAHATTSWRRGGQLWEVMGFLDDEAFAHH